MKKRETYLTEKVVYGGEVMTRGEMIADLQRVAAAMNHPNPQRLVDRYLQGHDRYTAARS